MKLIQFLKPTLLALSFSIAGGLYAQIAPGVYISDVDNIRHELKLTDNYLIHSVYEESPAKFIKTLGGYYSVDNATLNVKLEFNSNFEIDSVASLTMPFEIKEGQLIIETYSKLTFDQVESLEQDLDGQWLFATRGPDKGQKRRGEANTRKTLKYLQDNRFQWIAYDTEGMQFKGTGGGSFSSEDGQYIENIEYFSKDNSRVGASLDFKYEIKGDDWHHTGKNSKGEPMYEIWAER